MDGRDIAFAMQTAMLIMLIFITYFYRMPAQTISRLPQHVMIAPADGVVKTIDQIAANRVEYDYGSLVDWQNGYSMRGAENYNRIVIYLSVTNVHRQVMPITGDIVKVTYTPGTFYPAGLIDKSEFNERMIIKMRSLTGRIFFVVLLAGVLARTIVFHERNNYENIDRSTLISMIKLGSRVDVILPEDMPIIVKPGENVEVNHTAIAYDI